MAPIGVFAEMGEQRCHLVPLPLGRGSPAIEGLGNGLAGHGQLQGEAPGVERCLRPGRSGLRRLGLEVVRVRKDGGDGRGHEGGMQERLQGAWPLGGDRVEAVHGLVHPDATFDLPAHAGEVSDLPRAEPRGQAREKNAEESARPRGLVAADMHDGVKGAAVEDTCVVFQEGIEIRAGEELPGDLPARDRVDLRLPVVLEAADEAHDVRFVSPESRQTGCRVPTRLMSGSRQSSTGRAVDRSW